MSHQNTYALTNFSLQTGHTPSSAKDCDAILVSGKKIKWTGSTTDIPADCTVHDLQGLNISPGFIDLQLNGCGGVLFNNAITEETLDIMHASNLRTGCTAFLPTLITCSDEDMIQAVGVVRAYREKHPDRVPGIHIEGPYLNKARRGIHDERLIRQPDQTMIDFMVNNADVISMVTLAPEVCPQDIISQLANAGIVVAVGHSDATLEQVLEAEKSGARFITHLFNAMSQLQHRAPGVVGAAFTSDVLGAGIIADGHHLDWTNLLLAKKVMGDRLVLVTDATPAAGTDIKTFEFAGQTIYHENGKCFGKDGTIGGSALTMIEALQNCVKQGISLTEAIRMATINPASYIQMKDVMGDISPGHYANMILFNDDLDICGSISGGTLQLY